MKKYLSILRRTLFYYWQVMLKVNPGPLMDAGGKEKC
jgi:hypothetical protein